MIRDAARAHAAAAAMALPARAQLVALVMALVVMASAASAHNWVGSPSRARNAAVTKPCQVRVDPQPHVQVAAGQEFTMEWTVGHGDAREKWMYWLVVHESNYDKLNDVDAELVEEYLSMAPTSAYLYNATKWRKVHINHPADAAFGSQYGSQTPITASSDADYIARDSVMSARKNIYANNQYSEYRFFDQHTRDDVRVSYVNAKYPWIEAASKFRNSFAEHKPYADEFDMARFVLPARQGPGNYIYHFYWSGYRDCVDINVYPSTVDRPYGVHNPSAVTTYVKIDHCSFYYMNNIATGCRVVPRTTNSVAACMQECDEQSIETCSAVQATRVTNPNGTLPYNPVIPYYLQNGNDVDYTTTPPTVVGPCGSSDLNTRYEMGCRTVNPGCDPAMHQGVVPVADDYVCYGLLPYRDVNFQAIDDYIVTNDASDPRYYSTCWVKVPDAGFLPVPQPPHPTSKWDAGDVCLSCAYRDYAQSLASNAVARWADGMTSPCVNCDQLTA